MKWRAAVAEWAEVVLIGAVVGLIAAAIERGINAAEVEYFVKYGHTSDLFRGCPLHCSDPPEPQVDYLTPLGMTITAGKRKAWEIDLSHGWKRVNGERIEGGSEFAVRYYPFRRQ